MLSRDELERIFISGRQQPVFLDFNPPQSVIKSKSIQNREIATRRSLEEEILDEIAGLEGSPSFSVISSMVASLKKYHLLPEFSGIGVEVGAGLGLLSAAMVRHDEKNLISGIIALEAGKPFVEEGIRMAARATLGDQAFRIMPCYGSFDQIFVESNSVDFIIQIEALHHADELGPPVAEGFRILKTGGFFVSIDRSWPDEVHRKVLEELLDHQYSKEWLATKGFPSDTPFSRRDNGEHEYKDIDWESAFKSAGFVSKKIVHLHPEFKLWHFKKRVVGLLKLNSFARIKVPSRRGIFRGFIMQKTKFNFIDAGAVLESSHPRPLTVSVWQKL
jgi:SAM-dependent methyltransferase